MKGDSMRVAFGQGIITFESSKEMDFQDIIRFYFAFAKDEDIDHVKYFVDGKPINLKEPPEEAVNKISRIKVHELRMNCRYISEQIYFTAEVKEKSRLKLVMQEDLNYMSNDLKKKINKYMQLRK